MAYTQGDLDTAFDYLLEHIEEVYSQEEILELARVKMADALVYEKPEDIIKQYENLNACSCPP